MIDLVASICDNGLLLRLGAPFALGFVATSIARSRVAGLSRNASNSFVTFCGDSLLSALDMYSRPSCLGMDATRST